jgi:O-antigen ligase
VVGREPDVTPYRLALGLLIVASTLCLAGVALYLYRAWPLLSAAGNALGTAYCSLAEGLQLALVALIAVGFFLAPGLPLSLVALAVLGLLILMRPDHGLALVAFSVPFFLYSKLLAGKAFSLVEIGTLLCFATWAVRGMLAVVASTRYSQFATRNSLLAIRNLLRRLRSADWAVVSLVGLAVLSLSWAGNYGVASREFRVVILEASLFYLLLRVRAGRGGWRSYRLIVGALVAGAAAASLIGLWQYFVSGDVIAAEGVRRVRALYGSPNNLALFLERVALVAIALAWRGGDSRRRMGYALAVLPMFAALLLTFSKGALFIGLPVGFLFLGWMRGRRATLLALTALAVLAVALLPFLGTERFASTFDLTEGTAFFRLKLWRSTVNMIADHPLTGVGLDNFLYAYRTRYVLPEASDELNLSHPHNVVLDFWTRLGLGGVVVLMWLIVAFFRSGFDRYNCLPEGDDRAMVLGLLAGVTAALAHGLIDNAFFLVDLAFVFMLSLAVLQSPNGGTTVPTETDV